jgi:hypothetical protein
MQTKLAAGALYMAALIVVSANSGAVGSPGARSDGVSRTTPTLHRATFDHPRPNAYFPLRPGAVTTLRGSADGERFRERVHVTRRTKTILGVTTTVVTDVTHRADGTLAEKTTDWYAGDDAGNVWYFGEKTATYDQAGRLESREGTWQAGRHGARAGIIMPVDPGPTDAYRQEYRPGHAEDQAWIVGRRGHVTLPAGSYRRVVRSYEWTRLEPNVVSMKLYAPGVGIVAERDVAGGDEQFELVSIRG